MREFVIRVPGTDEELEQFANLSMIVTPASKAEAQQLGAAFMVTAMTIEQNCLTLDALIKALDAAGPDAKEVADHVRALAEPNRVAAEKLGFVMQFLDRSAVMNREGARKAVMQ